MDSMKLRLSAAEAALFARDLANTRGSVATPTYIAEKAGEVGDCTVISGADLLNHDLRLLHAVGKAGSAPPALIHLSHQGNLNGPQIAIVGKGVTFDTGGLNKKPTGSIEDMYLDKCGACIALGVYKWAAENSLPINLHVVLACAENAVDSDSYKPSDVIESAAGVTVEVGNTDAEGRLCLADAMTYIQR
jgi:leucyl aminopeptidase